MGGPWCRPGSFDARPHHAYTPWMATGPLIVFGGTFDPPHYAHLLAAECARTQFRAKTVLFVIAGDPYHKRVESGAAFSSQVAERTGGVSPARHRLAMLKRAIAANGGFAIDERELRRDGPSYTVDTLESLAGEPWAENGMVLLLGADSGADFWRWRAPQRILELATVAVVAKPGVARVPEPPLPHVDVAMPPLAISSSLVRARVAAGLPIRYLVPDGVAEYIAAEGLYNG